MKGVQERSGLNTRPPTGCREEALAQAVAEFEEGRAERAASDEAERQRVLAEVRRLELAVEEAAAQLKQVGLVANRDERCVFCVVSRWVGGGGVHVVVFVCRAVSCN